MPKDNFSDVEVLLEKNQSFTNTNSVKKIHALYGDLYPPEILAIFPLPLLEQITFDSAKVNAFDIQLFNLIKLQKSTAEIKDFLNKYAKYLTPPEDRIISSVFGKVVQPRKIADKYKLTPYDWAVLKGADDELLKLLKPYQWFSEKNNLFRETVGGEDIQILFLAFRQKNRYLRERLLKKYKIFYLNSIPDSLYEKMLMQAAIDGSSGILKYFFSQNALPSSLPHNRNYAFTTALLNGQVEVVDWMLDHQMITQAEFQLLAQKENFLNKLMEQLKAIYFTWNPCRSTVARNTDRYIRMIEWLKQKKAAGIDVPLQDEHGNFYYSIFDNMFGSTQIQDDNRESRRKIENFVAKEIIENHGKISLWDRIRIYVPENENRNLKIILGVGGGVTIAGGIFLLLFFLGGPPAVGGGIFLLAVISLIAFFIAAEVARVIKVPMPPDFKPEPLVPVLEEDEDKNDFLLHDENQNTFYEIRTEENVSTEKNITPLIKNIQEPLTVSQNNTKNFSGNFAAFYMDQSSEVSEVIDPNSIRSADKNDLDNTRQEIEGAPRSVICKV